MLCGDKSTEMCTIDSLICTPSTTHARSHTGASPAASTASDSGGRFAAWHSLSSLSATLWQPLLSAPWQQPLLSAFFRLRTSCSVAMAWDGLRRTPKSKGQGYRTCRGRHSRRNEPHRHCHPRNDPAARNLQPTNQPTNHNHTGTDRQHAQRDKARRHSAQPASQPASTWPSCLSGGSGGGGGGGGWWWWLRLSTVMHSQS
jgi:hypothetical protein